LGIKWDNIKILISPITNKIFLGKLDKTGMFATDKSKDRTDEMIDAVAGYLNKSTKGDDTGIAIRYESGTLTWKKNKVEETTK
jgi:hypothetical protein